MGRVGQDCDLVFRGNGRGISRRQETISGGGGGGRKAGLRVGLEGFWIWFFSGNGREGYQLSPRDSREGDYRKLTPNLLPMREGGEIKQ